MNACDKYGLPFARCSYLNVSTYSWNTTLVKSVTTCGFPADEAIIWFIIASNAGVLLIWATSLATFCARICVLIKSLFSSFWYSLYVCDSLYSHDPFGFMDQPVFVRIRRIGIPFANNSFAAANLIISSAASIDVPAGKSFRLSLMASISLTSSLVISDILFPERSLPPT